MAGTEERVPGGKDVTWVPTCDAVVARMLDMAGVSSGDHVIDLGSGDGRLVIEAARRGATATGVEYDEDKVELAARNAAAAGVDGRVTFTRADLFEVDLSRATVLTLFLLPALNLRLRPRILALQPGTRVATNTFDFGDWEADAKFEVPPPECTAHCWALHWVVPARVEGTWRTEGGEIVIRQAFQRLSGELRKDGLFHPAIGWLRGDTITLIAGGRTLHGHVRSDAIEGVWHGTGMPWRAVRR